MLASLNARKIFFRRKLTGPSIELAVAPSRTGIRVETKRTVWRDKSPGEATEDLDEVNIAYCMSCCRWLSFALVFEHS